MVSVDEVYKTVLLILNKEQRGYMTPNEFNKIGSQVQREIYERYFDDLAQQARVPQGTYDITMDGVTDLEYTDRLMMTDEKLSVFKKHDALTYDKQTFYPYPTALFDVPTDLYKLGGVTIQGYQAGTYIQEVQRVSRSEVIQLHKSKLTAPRFDQYPSQFSNPIYIYEYPKVYFFPGVIPEGAYDSLHANYLKIPSDVNWGYTVLNNGAFAFDNTVGNYQDFELHNSERTEIITNILLYAGIVIRDPQIVQAASAKIQQEEANEKS